MLTKFLYDHTKFKSRSMRIKGRKFRMYIAQGFAQKSIGLMYRESLGKDEGMLFLFPFLHRWQIWMLNMKFPIDVLWLDENGIVVHIEKSMQPCKGIFGCKSFAPDTMAKYVIELSATTASRLRIRKGDKIGVCT
ncbi:MAG: DUF192 domain-containing protein [Candidatus Micrarchaeota archaeon]|nr:DUF192 domain-containing protein [Candidatus Micrarchaeota archaeon]MDE1864166.1 DUF192 domain-containing protein [Candidatus Micrarchaeota archaeon]